MIWKVGLSLVVMVAGLAGAIGLGAEDEKLAVTGIEAVHRDGQTFVMWRDAAEGAAGARYRYSLYRSSKPITEPTLRQAHLVYRGVVNNSAKLFGADFRATDRLDPDKPTVALPFRGRPLPLWSGLAVYTAKEPGEAFYAVVATTEDLRPVTPVVSGESATTSPVVEKVAPIQPIRVNDSREGGQRQGAVAIPSRNGLPLYLQLHASEASGGGVPAGGDSYLYFGTERMGHRDGMPSMFSVRERTAPAFLLLSPRDAILNPSGRGAVETLWFGYFCVPQWAAASEPRAYPFTEERLLWLLGWVTDRYRVDRDRVFAGGGSMGAWGSMTFALRHPEIFAAIYPDRPRMRQRALPSFIKDWQKSYRPLMPDGTTLYFERMDMVKHVSEQHGDLPFIGWGIGRRDVFASWAEQVDMVRALKAARHGFAFAWNNGDHSTGGEAIAHIRKYYGMDRFARNQSYPAFSNSSIDNDPGNGDPRQGDLEGGINLGFTWTAVTDEPDRWTVRVANVLATTEMTVDVTPRRTQRFKLEPGRPFVWSVSSGATGKGNADRWGVVTVERIALSPGKETLVVITKP